MKIFVAGASGPIGQPLVAELIRKGHTVTGMTHSDAGAEKLSKAGAAVARVSAFDAPVLEEALRSSSAEAVIDELTALPKRPCRSGCRRAGRSQVASGRWWKPLPRGTGRRCSSLSATG